MFVIILLIILVILYLFFNRDGKTISTTETITESTTTDNFEQTVSYPFNPQIQTPQSNYDSIISKINSQQVYKSDLSVALAPTPTVQCSQSNLTNKSDCNKYGCNWFGNFCSSTYPTQV